MCQGGGAGVRGGSGLAAAWGSPGGGPRAFRFIHLVPSLSGAFHGGRACFVLLLIIQGGCVVSRIFGPLGFGLAAIPVVRLFLDQIKPIEQLVPVS